MLHISVAAEKLFPIFGVDVTNTVLGTWVVSLFLVLMAVIIRLNLNLIPDKVQVGAELIIDWIRELTNSVSTKFALEFFPLAMTLFLFILFSNWFGLLPGISEFGLKEVVEGEEKIIPLFRAATTDLNTTIALAVIVFVAVQYYGFKYTGAKKYLGKFFDFSSGLNFYVGFLELIAEFSKTLALAFRLFGNIFAGEVLLAVMASLLPLLLPLPFITLELFIGMIQSVVFALLALVYMGGAVEDYSTVESHG